MATVQDNMNAILRQLQDAIARKQGQAPAPQQGQMPQASPLFSGDQPPAQPGGAMASAPGAPSQAPATVDPFAGGNMPHMSRARQLAQIAMGR